MRPSDYLRKRYQGKLRLRTLNPEEAYEPINFKQPTSEVKLPQIPSYEQMTLKRLPIFNQSSNFAMENSAHARSKNPVNKSTIANLSQPSSANFFKLHPIQAMSSSQDNIDKAGSSSSKSPRPFAEEIAARAVDGSNLEEFIHSFVQEGNAKKKFYEV